MGRLLPCPLGRPRDLLAAPAVGERLPGRRAGFTAGDPRAWIPGVLQALEKDGQPVLPWTRECDLLLAPYPEPGREAELLRAFLGQLAPDYPVALYERDVPVLPNLVVPSGDREASGRDFAEPPAGLRAFRSVLRHRGRGGAEALVLLPARRAGLLLKGSFFAQLHPGPAGSLQNRRFLVLALDHQRSLMLTARTRKPAAGLPPAGRTAVVMPHFDDESIQCGGAVAAARRQGEVRLIWLTDGGQGVPGTEPGEASRLRKEEARTAAAALGVDDLHFLDAPETRLARGGPWTRRLQGLLLEFRPQRLHTVWWADNHIDHFEAVRVLRAAWNPALGETEIAASGFWTPVPGNRLLPLNAELRAAKDAALGAHASQLREVDYLRAERGLACWYARDLPAAGEAESFLALPAPEYWARYRASGAGRRWFVPRRGG